ncbi:MAG: patatin-like phospholipase family protein [Deltaproteobacteria bacterium]|nr:patatin-like phospholipase family protein [Deltaproteobacteria bacterium]
MAEYLSIYAGDRARDLISEQGLTPEMVEVVAGAAGGPKWLVLCGLDRAIFSDWIFRREKPLYLVGSSVGSWRFAALAQGMDAYERFLDAYFRQTYKKAPTAGVVSAEIGKILDAYLDGEGTRRILNHPTARLNTLAVRCSWPCSVERRYPLLLAMACAGVLNLASRKLLGGFFSRALFYDGRDIPPFFTMKGFPIQRVPLTRGNLRHAVMASGSMPALMEGVRDIPGARPGMYRDAGILDYHVDIPFHSSSIVLYPHYMGRITTGWFDKMLFWRKPDRLNLENVVLLCPGRAFMESLPGAKIPSRQDFWDFRGRDEERIAYWRQVVSSSEALGNEFREILEKGTILEHLRPIGELRGSPPRTLS